MIIDSTSVLAIGVFSLAVLVVVFAWLCLLELSAPVSMSRFAPCRAHQERRVGERRQRSTWPEIWRVRHERRHVERRGVERRRSPVSVELSS